MDSVEYFRKKLTEALNIPLSRLEANTNFNIGRSSEINRDELKFYKFVKRLRNQFSEFWLDLLRTQCELKQIISPEEFDEYKYFFYFNYNTDNYFSELKNEEVLKERIYSLQNIDSYVGKYYSEEYIKKNILKQTDEEIATMQKQMDEDKKIQRERELEDAKYQAELDAAAMSLSPDESTDGTGEDGEVPSEDGEEKQNLDLSGNDLTIDTNEKKSDKKSDKNSKSINKDKEDDTDEDSV